MAPWHSFDDNTARALQDVGILTVTDGYGLYPYGRSGVLLVPQMTQRPLPLPMGCQTLCFHINTFDDRDFDQLESFCRAQERNIVGFPEAMAMRSPWPWKAVDGSLGKAAYFLLSSRRRLWGLYK